MTKVYKIGNTEINEYDINNLNHDYIKFKFDELLEALSDKEECNHNWVGFSAMECSRCGKRDEEPKQEEWKPCTCPKGSTDCDKCDGVEWVKQSISLKEWITEIVSRSISVHTITDSVLKLLQSHLVKEIEKEYAATIKGTEYFAREDIIKIINNITKII